MLVGMPEMPRPPRWPKPNGDPVFFDDVYRTDPVRAVAVLRNLYFGGLQRQVLVVVAESTGQRQAAEDTARRQEMLRDARMLALVALLVWWGVNWALSPLRRLRNEISSRSPEDLTPLDADHVPSEVVPLVDAVNHHIARHRKVLDQQTQFLADASHQLRTPLAIMLTQAQYALREPDPVRAREGLRAIVDQLGRTRRLTEQLLSLAHASQADSAPRERFDLNQVARDVVLRHLPLAHEKRQDLGWVDIRSQRGVPGEAWRDDAPVWGIEAELHEAIANLVHNAIRYAPEGARVTVAVSAPADRAEVLISDNGPGIPASLRKRAFARFDRVGADRSAQTSSGSGLGLSIARAYARRNGGDIELRDGDVNSEGGHGLAAILWVPLLRDYPAIQPKDSR
jgi:two-component system sensor histidine kinase TctE